MHKPTFNTWRSMVQRCHNPNHVSYANYGGTGIIVCARWRKYANFVADMGERPEGMTIDRMNNAGNYEPGKCRWATVTQQYENKTSNVYLTRDGVTQTVTEWAKELGVARTCIYNRIYRGTPMARVLDGL